MLGKLVFGSQTVVNGRPFMQSMLSSFQGCEVDWRRGRVSFRGGANAARMSLPDGFWADVDWWLDHLQKRYSTPWAELDRPLAAVLGTDASGWGSGQLAWIDGGREESQLRFTHAETRRPINWRELSGIVRAVQLYGPRLSGYSVLVETDNMAAKGSAARRSSRAADMQELVRRLVRLCERHDIRLKLTHTPGLKLDRPDQISRGDPVIRSLEIVERAPLGAPLPSAGCHSATREKTSSKADSAMKCGTPPMTGANAAPALPPPTPSREATQPSAGAAAPTGKEMAPPTATGSNTSDEATSPVANHSLAHAERPEQPWEGAQPSAEAPTICNRAESSLSIGAARADPSPHGSSGTPRSC